MRIRIRGVLVSFFKSVPCYHPEMAMIVDFDTLLRQIGQKQKRHRAKSDKNHSTKKEKHRVFYTEVRNTNWRTDFLIIEGASDSSWPLKTNVWCHWCCHPFDTEPVPLPTKRKPNGTFVVRSNTVFCSIPCARAYAKKEDLDDSLVVTMALEIYGFMFTKTVERGKELNLEAFQCAPPREVLRDFGGKLSIEEYRSTFRIIRRLVFPPYNIETIKMVTRTADISDEEESGHAISVYKEKEKAPPPTSVLPPPSSSSVPPRRQTSLARQFFSEQQLSWDRKSHGATGLGALYSTTTNFTDIGESASPSTIISGNGQH